MFKTIRGSRKLKSGCGRRAFFIGHFYKNKVSLWLRSFYIQNTNNGFQTYVCGEGVYLQIKSVEHMVQGLWQHTSDVNCADAAAFRTLPHSVFADTGSREDITARFNVSKVVAGRSQTGRTHRLPQEYSTLPAGCKDRTAPHPA